MKRFLILFKSKSQPNIWVGHKRYKTKKGAIDAITALRKKKWDIPKYYNLDVIKIKDSSDGSASMH